jgi:hypothetical protein
LTSREFKRSVRDYGYPRDPVEVFAVLNQERLEDKDSFRKNKEGAMQPIVVLDDMLFLDEWEVEEIVRHDDNDDDEEKREQDLNESAETKETRSILAEMKKHRGVITRQALFQEKIREAGIGDVRELVNQLKFEKARSAELRNRSTGVSGKMDTLANGAVSPTPPTTAEQWLKQQSSPRRRGWTLRRSPTAVRNGTLDSWRGPTDAWGTKDSWTVEKNREAESTSTVENARRTRLECIRNSRMGVKDLRHLRSVLDQVSKEALAAETKTADLKEQFSERIQKLKRDISNLKKENDELQGQLDGWEKSLRQIVSLAIR